jgi:hypothetical protein
MTIQSLQGLNISVITELTIATLFARVFVERHQMACCHFLYLSLQLMALCKTIEPPSIFVASY